MCPMMNCQLLLQRIMPLWHRGVFYSPHTIFICFYRIYLFAFIVLFSCFVLVALLVFGLNIFECDSVHAFYVERENLGFAKEKVCKNVFLFSILVKEILMIKTGAFST